ncbi:MAG: ABC transporter permease [Chloracidobacterium sp.]|nr:ABC transporter permease [Chloracidobacterium sp.]
MKPHLWLIQFIGVIVPRRLRADWRQEWEAELRYRETLLAEWDKLNRKSKVDLLWHSLGAFCDALWLQPRRWEDAMVQDIRYSVRMLAKNPGFTLMVVLTLALGIGANTAIFTLFNSQLRPLPIKDPDAVVRLDYHATQKNWGFSFSDYLFFREQSQVFSGLLACSDEKFLLGDQTASTEVEEVAGKFVSDNFFSVLGVSPVRGRTFTTEEISAPGREPVVVISHQLWQTRFGADPNIVGQTLRLNNKPFVVIGVMGQGFGFGGGGARLWLPLTMRTEMLTVYYDGTTAEERHWFDSRSFQWLDAYGRLKPGRTMEEAQAETRVLMGQLRQAWPEIDPQAGVDVEPAQHRLKGFLQLMAIVLGATGIVLLIACSNITNLLLARATHRRKEIGIRLCLGATRRRVMRQLLTESLLLAGLGGVAGLIVARWCLEALAFLWGPDLGGLASGARPDSRVLAFTFAASLLSGTLSGLAPALRATRPDLIAITKDETGAFGQSLTRSWLRNGLVIAQVALSLVLLIPAGLLVRGLWRALAIDPGYETKKALVVGYSLELSGYDDARARRFNQELMDRLKAMSGVQSVILGASPLRGTGVVTLPDVDVYDLTGRQRDNGYSVSPGFFATAGIQLTRGREFTEEEARAGAQVVVVSESTARRLWPGGDSIGKTLRVQSGEASHVAQVVGVARDAQTWRFGQIPPVFAYIPLVQRQWQDLSVLVRTSRDANEIKPLVRAAAREMEPTLRLWMETPEEEFANSKWGYLVTKMASQLASALGLLALLLAAIGVHGVMAYSVSQRTREIGIRIALGASRRDAMRLVLGQGLRLVGIGAALGLAGGAAISRASSIMFYGLSPLDPITYLSVALLLAAVAVLAIYLPARRASTVDPMVALRHE